MLAARGSRATRLVTKQFDMLHKNRWSGSYWRIPCNTELYHVSGIKSEVCHLIKFPFGSFVVVIATDESARFWEFV